MDKPCKNVIEKFDCYGDPSTLGTRWSRWLKSFELFADASGLIINEETSTLVKQRRRAQLLHYAGPDVQDIFYTLPNTGEADDYQRAVNALNSHFIPKVNSAYARHKVRLTQQNEGETVLQFVTRLRRLIRDCDFGDDSENQIRDEVLQKCRSDYLRRKLLEEGEGLTLKRTLEIAEQCEKVEVQLASMTVTAGRVEKVVNQVRNNRTNKKNKQQKTSDDTCYRCGKFGHYGRDPKCPEKGKTCGGKNHFARVCKTKNPDSKNNPSSKNNVNQLDELDKDSNYAFHVSENDNSNTLVLLVGGVNMNFLIDSGAASNIVDEGTWEILKSKHVKCTSSTTPPSKKLFSYASTKPLNIKGCFQCEVKVQ